VQRGGEFLSVKDAGQTIDLHQSKMNFENESKIGVVFHLMRSFFIEK
jgi:hypothetical protein